MSAAEKSAMICNVLGMYDSGLISASRCCARLMEICSEYRRINNIVTKIERNRKRSSERINRIRKNNKEQYLHMKANRVNDLEIARIWGIGSSTLDTLKKEWDVIKKKA